MNKIIQDGDEVVIIGYGRMTFGQVKKSIQQYKDDVQKFIDRDDYQNADYIARMLKLFLETAARVQRHNEEIEWAA